MTYFIIKKIIEEFDFLIYRIWEYFDYKHRK